MQKILLVEDESSVVSFIKKGLQELGYEVAVAFDGNMAINMSKNNTFDLLILDIMLPEKNGLDVCKEIRSWNSTIPILFLTALGSSENIVLGLENGGDDYLVKPFKFVELVARIKSLMRRSSNFSCESNDIVEEYSYKIKDLIVNDFTKTVKKNEVDVTLTSTEYKLLLYFLNNKERVVSRSEILDAVWGVNYDLGTNVVDVYVNYLRKKIDNNPEVKLIHTVIGMGYVLKEGNE